MNYIMLSDNGLNSTLKQHKSKLGYYVIATLQLQPISQNIRYYLSENMIRFSKSLENWICWFL